MTPTPTPPASVSARAFLRVVVLIVPAIVLVLVLASSDARWVAQTGETMTGATTEEAKDYSKEAEEAKESVSSAFSGEQDQTDTERGSTMSTASASFSEPEQTNAGSESVSSVGTSSVIQDQIDTESGSTTSAASASSTGHSLASLASSSSFHSSSPTPLSLDLPAIRLLANAEGSQHTPVLAIAKGGDIRKISDIVGNINVTLMGFGKTLVTDLRMEEADDEILVSVETPAVFRPGAYDLRVTWTHSRSDVRLLQKFFDAITGAGEEVILLEERIALGALSPDLEREQTVASTEGDLAITRTSVIRTTPGAEETMTIVVTPKATFLGSITERVPAGFTVHSVTPFAEITETENETLLRWNREFTGGAALTLTYAFTAAPVAPLYAQFGRIEARGTITEERMRGEEVREDERNRSVEDPEDVAYESSSISSSEVDQTDTGSGSTTSSTGISSDIRNESSAGISSSPLLLFSSSTPHSSSSDSSTQDAPEVSSGASFSWIRHLLAQLLQGDPFRFTEQSRWAMLVEPAEEDRDMRRAEALQLTPRNGGVFDANALPSFTLVNALLSATGADMTDAKGRFQEEKALVAIVHALTDEKMIKETVLQTLLEDRKEDIADAITNDSVALNILLDGSVPRNARRAAAAKAEDALNIMEKRKEASVILSEEREILRAMDALVTFDVERDIVEQAIKTGMGKKATKINDLLTRAAGKSAVMSAADAVTDAVRNAHGTQQKLAEAMVVEKKAQPTATKQPIVTVTLRDAKGNTSSPAFHFVPGSVVLVIEPERTFTPGLYHVDVSIFNPLTQETQTQSTEFAWGVLAMNAAQDRYQAGDIVELAIGVLDDGGRIVCDAEMELVVKHVTVSLPNRETITPPFVPRQARDDVAQGDVLTLSTADNSIKTGDTCGLKEAGLIEPDYSTSFTAVEAGVYELTLTATTPNGTRSMTSTIEVGEPPFLIRRIGATRLWPLAPSPMEIIVDFHVPLTGTITETVPADFDVSQIRPAATVRTREDGSKMLQWKGSWQAGEKAAFRYVYDAPDVSPEFYLLGPLQISSALPIPAAP